MPTATLTKPTFRDVFAKHQPKVWKHRYHVELYVENLTGGTPNDPRVIEKWLRTKVLNDNAALNEAISKTMVEMGVDPLEDPAAGEKAMEKYISSAHLNGFKRVEGQLIYEGRNAKAAIKEAFGVALGSGHIKARGWGETNKGSKAFVAEHIMIPDRYIPILREDGSPFTEPTGINQRFVHTHNGDGIQYEEFCDPALLRFEVWTDWDFDQHWPTIWSIGGKQGVGATRSMGCGVYFVSRWDKQS